MNNEKKISPLGESWGEYRKKHYTVEKIAEMLKISTNARYNNTQRRLV